MEETIKKIGALDERAISAARARQDILTKPAGSLGTLEDISTKVAGITGNAMPKMKNKVIITMAGDHGVTDDGVSAYPKEVTAQMVYNFLNDGAAINVLARHAGARVVIVDMGVAVDFTHERLVSKKIAYGTANMAKGPAMSYEDAVRSIEAGIEVFELEAKKGVDIVGVGDMGIGNTTPSSAIVAVITGYEVEKVTGRGTGIDDAGLEKKKAVIEEAIRVNKPNNKDAIDVLAKVGGFEIGGMAGVILAAASHRVPVVIDGFISGTAALVAYGIAPAVKDYMIAAHRSVERGHSVTLDYIGLKPLLDLDMRLGEGTGAALGISIVDAACKILGEMATFEDAGVSEKS
uniref:Nicotinate-nucleotide--dimethylbenzimidazole phosphoribosyltransferase n=1 Tax=Candidatus Methanophaga sp. ANME-1 ERB7 TaxID=2759913 RepID=A0A7G9Z7J2_9EURY|nr:nicotinate-nucleotide--dimethylbenzimidazole phosphoribosyltransferase [Methanosarcinales archaeon ANME-1 ERB7]